MSFSVGDTCFIMGYEGAKEVLVDRGLDSDGYYLVELDDEQIIPALGTQMYHNINDCIDNQVLLLQKKIESLNSQRVN